mmetsp:Transcript_27756/g.65035  ORF Transcript_27756/g.65035 Transcript_27756/m.65035 type:complete len:206 (+) Transcript_27756:440-1057(+)
MTLMVTPRASAVAAKVASAPHTSSETRKGACTRLSRPAPMRSASSRSLTSCSISSAHRLIESSCARTPPSGATWSASSSEVAIAWTDMSGERTSCSTVCVSRERSASLAARRASSRARPMRRPPARPASSAVSSAMRASSAGIRACTLDTLALTHSDITRLTHAPAGAAASTLGELGWDQGVQHSNVLAALTVPRLGVRRHDLEP